MSEELFQRLSEAVEQMPAFPESVHRVIELTNSIDCSPRDLVSVIEHDVVMTAKLLKWVNSPYFGLAQKIQNVNHAVVYVGLNTIKNLALSISTIGTLPESNDANFDTSAFLAHSLGAATISRFLALQVGVPQLDASNYFVAGLLHDFGKVVLAMSMPAEFRRALDIVVEEGGSLHEAERRVIGTDHAEVGAMLCERWQLPPELASATRDHHAMAGEPSLMRDTVFVANQLIKRLRFGNSGNPVVVRLPPEIGQRFADPLRKLLDDLPSLQRELKGVTSFVCDEELAGL